MNAYPRKLAESASARRCARILEAILARPALHARFVNTLARLEYVGVRKMLKARRAERLDLRGLEHILDEAVHALRLKRAATAIAADARDVGTFAAPDTLAGDAGEDYFQAVDRAAERALSDLPEPVRGEASYLLTSAVIEIRAEVFYPLYEAALQAAGAKLSVASILRDEDRHIDEVGRALAAAVPGWRERLDTVLAAEGPLFEQFLDALEAATGARDGASPKLDLCDPSGTIST